MESKIPLPYPKAKRCQPPRPSPQKREQTPSPRLKTHNPLVPSMFQAIHDFLEKPEPLEGGENGIRQRASAANASDKRLDTVHRLVYVLERRRVGATNESLAAFAKGGSRHYGDLFLLQKACGELRG